MIIIDSLMEVNKIPEARGVSSKCPFTSFS